MADETKNIYAGSPGYFGVMSPVSSTGSNVTITFTKGGTNGESVSDFFLVEGYSLQWGRSVQVRRALNNPKPLAVVGYGAGALSVRGMVGAKESFKKIFGSSDDVCEPLTCVITGGNNITTCGEDNTKIDATKITVTGLISNGISIGGSVDAGGTIMQTASAQFQITGVSIA